MLASKGSCHVSIPERPFLTLPTRCDGPLATTISAESWQRPPGLFEQTVHTPEPPPALGLSGCASLRFAPTIAAKPTTAAASSPAGLDFSLDVEATRPRQRPAATPARTSKSRRHPARGDDANPSLAEGLGVCTEAELAQRTARRSAPAARGLQDRHVEVQTPLLEGKL